MTPKPIITFVRSVADLRQACSEISGFFSVRRRLNPTLPQDEILGLWIDEHLTTNLPTVLELRTDCTGSLIASIREMVGIDGIWNLCWVNLEPSPPAGYRLRHSDIVETLLAARDPQTEVSSVAFIPIFPTNVPTEETRKEMERLTQHHPRLVQAPIHWDAGHGRLELGRHSYHGAGARH